MDWSDADAGLRTPRVEQGMINHFLEASERSWPCQHLDFALLTSVTMRENIFFFSLATQLVIFYNSPIPQISIDCCITILPYS